MYHDNRGRHSAHHTLLPNMYHDTRGSHSALHTLLPNTYQHTELGSLDCRGAVPNVRHSYTDDPSSIPVRLVLHHGDNRGRHSVTTTCLNLYLSAHHTLLPNMHHDNTGWLSACHTLITEVITQLTTPCYLTYNTIKAYL